MDFSELINVLADYSNLDVEKLVEETAEMTREINEINDQIGRKMIVVDELDNELSELRPLVERLAEKSDSLDVDLIRAKTRQKKVKKGIEKLRTINSSCPELEVRGNDKLKLSKKMTELHLTTSLLKIFLTDENHAIVMNAQDHQLNIVDLNNDSNQVNREKLWKCIGQSQYTNEWQQLL